MRNIVEKLKKTGPGIIVAATGLGAGDIIAASVAGATFGTTLLWAVLLGGLLKFVLNEGIARWQLVTGKTLLEGWIDHLPRWVTWYFLIYLLLWTFMVAAALMAATGLAAHAMLPMVSVSTWGIGHAITAVVIVMLGGYRGLEHIMKLFIGLMFAAVLTCALLVLPAPAEILRGMVLPAIPPGSLAYVLGIIGGVGGSVTMLSYGYWMREAGWTQPGDLTTSRTDLALAYGLTALFGVAIVLVAAGVRPEVATGSNMALAVAEHLQSQLGAAGKWIFLLGFWGAVFSSMIGVWHGVPYLFANFYYHLRHPASRVATSESIARSRAYRGYLIYLATLPMLMLSLDRPVWVVVLYAITGAFFMPLVAAMLLYMNGKSRWLGQYRNGWRGTALLLVCLALFAYLMLVDLHSRLW